MPRRISSRAKSGRFLYRRDATYRRLCTAIEKLESRDLLATITFTDLNPPHEITITSPMGRLLSNDSSANLEFDIKGPGGVVLAQHKLQITATRQDGAKSSPVGREPGESTFDIFVPVAVLPGPNTFSFTFTAFLEMPTRTVDRELSESVDVARNRLLNIPDRSENTTDQMPIVITLANPGDEPDSDPITATIQDIPADGSLEQFDGTPIASAGTVVTDPQLRVRFVPRPNNTSPVSLSFVLNDGLENSRETTIQIAVTDVEPPPPGRPDLEASTDSGPAFVTNPSTDDFTRGDDPEPSQSELTFNVADVEAGASVRIFRDGTPQGSGPVPDADNDGVVTITIPVGSQTGTFDYTARQTDPGGNISDPSPPLSVIVDLTPPEINDLQIAESDRFSFGNNDPPFGATTLPTAVTDKENPTFTFELIEQTFGKPNNLMVELLERQGTLEVQKNSFIIPFDASDTDQTISGNFSTPGRHVVFVRVTDTAGNVTESPDFLFFYIDLDTQSRDTQGAPGTPVYNQFYDLFTAIQGNQPRDNEIEDDLWPWTVAFDNSTQTYWFTMEHGGKLGHFDPAKSTLRYYDISGQLPLPNGFANPHGVTFDFDSHLTPRVWFVHRNAGGINAGVGGSEGDIGKSTLPENRDRNGNGRLSYLDLSAVVRNADPARTGPLEPSYFSYDLAALKPAEPLFFDDTHAVFVDTRGTVWVTSDHGDKILEIDFDQPGNLASTVARMWVHQVPHELTPHSGAEHGFHPHALQVVVDDVTGEQYVWAISEGGTGRSLLLRPRLGSAGVDQWYSFGPGTNTPGAQLAVDTRGTFVQIDDNETPGRPHDDKIVLTFPVRDDRDPNKSTGIIQVLDPAQAFGVPPSAAKANLRTWIIETAPGQTPPSNDPSKVVNQPYAVTNQPFTDRAGTIYYVDRLGSVGRFSPDDPSEAEMSSEELNTGNGGILFHTSSGFITNTSFFPEVRPSHQFVMQGIGPVAVPLSPSPAAQTQRPDIAFQDGVDQYEVAGSQDTSSKAFQRGTGPFRGFLSAGQILFGTITQTEELSTTVFAETARRQMASVVSPTPLPDGVVRGRMAFQILRDGRVILTGRGDGVIIDRQIDLTNLVRQNPANNDIGNLRMNGDPSATMDANGVVFVFGLAQDGSLLVYQYRGGPAPWAHDSLFNANNWTAFKLFSPDGQRLIGDPTAYTDSTGGAKALVTTNNGHLLLYQAVRASTATDLFALLGGSQPVYASVGVVAQGNQVFAHGTNQLGGLVQYKFSAFNPTSVMSGVVVPVAGLDPAQTGVVQPRDAFVFQSVEAVLAGGKRHVFAMDGNSRLVHFEFDSELAVARATNVSNVVTANNQAFGYFNFQQPFGGRAYTETAPVVGQDGTVFIYGTNGRDLIEFKKLASGGWQAANLTNDIFSTDGPARTATSRVGANEVFGAPTAYLQPDGERHILQINADGEVVEYFYTPQTSPPRFHTQNINLASGNQFSQSSQVSVTVTAAGVLVVTGDGSANGVAITGTGVPGQYIVTGLDDADGTPTVVGSVPNGTTTVEGVFTGIDINLGDGADYVSLDNTFIGGSIVVRTGAGNDVVQIGTRQIVTMRGDLVIDLGQGDDQLDLQRSYVVRHLVVDGGEGNDSLRPNNASTLRDFVLRAGTGADTLHVRQVAVVGSWLIDGGAESDNISLTNSAATGATAIFGRDGNDSILFEACFFDSSFFVDGDSGQDSVELSGVIGNADTYLALGSGDDQARLRHSILHTLVIEGAEGNDRAEIMTSLLDDLFASLGSGDDHLSVITNRIRRSHRLDGGAGDDELLARANDPLVLTSGGFERG
jgi:streptogramin lyase